MPLCRTACVCLLLGTALGCGGPRTYPVEGRVTFKEDGAPMRRGQVVFEPIDSTQAVSASGYIDDDGYFILTTFKRDDGAFAGEYRAVVMPPFPTHGKDLDLLPTPRSSLVIDERYLTFDTSGLQFTVKKERNDIHIQVTKPGKRPGP